MTKSQLNLTNVPSRAPTLRDKSLAADIVVEKVQCLINQLLLRHNVLPAREALGDGDELGPAVRAGVVQDDLQILEAGGNLTHRIRTLVGVRVDGINGGAHRRSNLTDPGEQHVTVREDDEHVLAGLDASLRVHERLLDVNVVHVEVATEHTPEDALERRQTSAVDGPSNEPANTVNSPADWYTADLMTYSRSS